MQSTDEAREAHTERGSTNRADGNLWSTVKVYKNANLALQARCS